MKRRFLTTLTLVLIGLAPAAAMAETLVVGADATLASVLAAQVGQRVYVLTASGETSGVVKTVGASVVHLESIAGRDFYDAVIPLDKIQSVQIRVRGQ